MIGWISKTMGRTEYMPMAGPAPSYFKSFTEQNSGFIRPRLLENNIDPLVVSEVFDSRMEEGAHRAIGMQGRWDVDPE